MGLWLRYLPGGCCIMIHFWRFSYQNRLLQNPDRILLTAPDNDSIHPYSKASFAKFIYIHTYSNQSICCDQRCAEAEWHCWENIGAQEVVASLAIFFCAHCFLNSVVDRRKPASLPRFRRRNFQECCPGQWTWKKRMRPYQSSKNESGKKSLTSKHKCLS